MKTMLEYVTIDPVLKAKSKLDSLNGATANLTSEQILSNYFRN